MNDLHGNDCIPLMEENLIPCPQNPSSNYSTQDPEYNPNTPIN